MLKCQSVLFWHVPGNFGFSPFKFIPECSVFGKSVVWHLAVMSIYSCTRGIPIVYYNRVMSFYHGNVVVRRSIKVVILMNYEEICNFFSRGVCLPFLQLLFWSNFLHFFHKNLHNLIYKRFSKSNCRLSLFRFLHN